MGCDILTNHSCLNLLDLFTELRNLKDGLDAYINILNLILGDATQDIYFGNQVVLLPESDLVSFASQVKAPNKIYIIRYDYDLNTSEISIPKNCTLKFEGGKIYNGSIVGNETHIISDTTSEIMSNISVSGTFKNDVVYSSWVNWDASVVAPKEGVDKLTLQTALNLCNGNTLTKLFVAHGDYNIIIVKSEDEDDKNPYYQVYEFDEKKEYKYQFDEAYNERKYLARGGLIIPGNTDVDFQNSTLKVYNPQNFLRYNLILITEDNISLKNGNLIGDVYEHLPLKNGQLDINNNKLKWTGEWGFGVSIKGAKNVILDNINASLFWGDGFYIGDTQTDYIDEIFKYFKEFPNPEDEKNRDKFIDVILPENILIRNCVCEYNRRQGLSVIAVKGLKIYDSKFINTGYAPDKSLTYEYNGVNLDLHNKEIIINGEKVTNDEKWKYTAPGAGIDFEQNWQYKQLITDVIIDGCDFSGNRKGIVVNDKLELDEYCRTFNVTIKDCIIGGTTQVKIKRDTNFKFLNCIFDGWVQHGDGDVTFDNCTFNGHWHIIRGTKDQPERNSTINVNFCRFNLSSFYSDRCVFRVSELVGTKSLRLVGCVFDVNNMPDPTKGNNITFPLVKVSSKSNKDINFDNLDLRLLNCTFQCSDNARNFSYFGWDIWASNAIIGCTINECKKITIYRRTTGVNDLDEPITDYSFKLRENIIRFKRQVDYKPATGGDNNSNDNSSEDPIIPNPEDGDESVNNEETNGGNESGDNENTGGDENPPHSETEEESGENGDIGSDISGDGEGNDNQQDPQPEVIPDPYFYCEGNVKRGTDKRDIIITDNIFFFDAKEAPLWKMPNYEEGLNKMTLVMKRNVSVGKVISGRPVLSRITGDGIITDQESGIERFSTGNTFNHSTDNAFNYLSDERSDADSNFIILSDLQDVINGDQYYGFTGLQAIDLKTGILAFNNGTSWVDCMGQKFGSHRGTTNNRPDLTSSDKGFQYYDTSLERLVIWNGSEWKEISDVNAITEIFVNNESVTRSQGNTRYIEIPLINDVEVTIDGGNQEASLEDLPLAEGSILENSQYGRTLKLDFSNLKGKDGRGIENINIAESDPSEIGVEIIYTDGNSISFSIPKGTPGQKGDPGTKGATGIYSIEDGEVSELPIFTLETTVGLSETSGMTQKAITDIVATKVLEYNYSDLTSMGAANFNDVTAGTVRGIQPHESGDYWRDSTFYRGILIPLINNNNESLYKGGSVVVSPTVSGLARQAKMAFVVVHPSDPNIEINESNNKIVTYADGCSLVDVDEDINVMIPSDAKYLYVSRRESSEANRLNAPSYVAIYLPYKYALETLSDTIQDHNRRISSLEDDNPSINVVNNNLNAIGNCIGVEDDTTNICDPTKDVVGKSMPETGIPSDDISWNYIPVPVKPGKTYYFYYNGECSNIRNSNKRAFNANGSLAVHTSGNLITIPSDATEPVTLYINHANNNEASADPNKIMVSLRSDLTKHYEYGTKVYGSNLPQVDPLDHTPTLKEDPLAEIISHPSRARLFPIWGVIGGSFETGYTNGKKRTNDEEKTFYDNSNGSAVPVTSGWGYEWPTLFGELNHVTVGDYAIEGHSFYRWLQKVKTTNPTNFGNDGKLFQAFIINMSGNEIGNRGFTNSSKYPYGFKYGNASDIDWNNNYTDFSLVDNESATYFLDEMTYCEMIAAIVQMVREIQPDCHIFFTTLRKDSTRTGDLLTYANDMVRIFKEMQKITPNSHLIDLYEYGIDWGIKTIKTRYIRGSHPTRLGHIYLCDEFNTYIDWIIGKNPELFRDAAYIGTNYKL